jgi:hypothetical protein
MKKLVFVLLMGLGLSANAQEAALNCAVPNGTATFTIAVMEDTSSDFVLFTLKDGANENIYYTQTAKGEIATGIAQGGMSYILTSEDSQRVNGVVTKGAFFGLGQAPDGSLFGYLMAQGNIYPVLCEATNKPAPQPAPAPTPTPVEPTPPTRSPFHPVGP